MEAKVASALQPLAEARVEVWDVATAERTFEVVAWVRPHYQFYGLTKPLVLSTWIEISS